MSIPKKILEEVLALSPKNKVDLVDRLLASLDTPENGIDRLWKEEVESRIDAYERGDFRALAVDEVLQKYK